MVLTGLKMRVWRAISTHLFFHNGNPSTEAIHITEVLRCFSDDGIPIGSHPWELREGKIAVQAARILYFDSIGVD